MEWIGQGLLALVISVPVALGLALMIKAGRLTRLPLYRSSLRIVAKEALPDPVRLRLGEIRTSLDGLGLQYRYTTASERLAPQGGNAPLFTDVYQHVEGHTHVLATLSMSAEKRVPCTLMWVTLFQSGLVLATVNGYRHNLVSAPKGWVMYDDYLPNIRAVGERHRRRLTATRQSVVEDGVEFFWATKEATEQFMPQCEKKGLLVRHDDHWRMPWRVALPFAWKLWIGQRKAARMRARSSAAGPANA